jgi:Rad3-related DNA helicase
VTIFHDDLDQSKIAALAKCAQRRPITILHGPPGTGKTTALAAAVLSAVTQGERVLVTAPSHAACDAFLMALIRYWPVDMLGDPSAGAVVRLGKELRFSVPAVRHFMPLRSRKSGDDDVGIAERKLVKLREELLQEKLPAKQRGSALREEVRLVSDLKKKANAVTSEAVAASKVTVCTNHQAGDLLTRHNIPIAFDLVCVDEAGFARVSDVVPVIMKAPRLILSGDHQQLPPVVHSQVKRLYLVS